MSFSPNDSATSAEPAGAGAALSIDRNSASAAPPPFPGAVAITEREYTDSRRRVLTRLLGAIAARHPEVTSDLPDRLARRQQLGLDLAEGPTAPSAPATLNLDEVVQALRAGATAEMTVEPHAVMRELAAGRDQHRVHAGGNTRRLASRDGDDPFGVNHA